jgi:hypothetical protein
MLILAIRNRAGVRKQSPTIESEPHSPNYNIGLLWALKQKSLLLHLFTATAPRRLISAFAGRGSFSHFDLTATFCVWAPILLTFLKRHCSFLSPYE